MTLSMRTRACYSAATGLGHEDTSRFIELHDQYLAAGATAQDAARSAAADLVAEIYAEADDLGKLIGTAAAPERHENGTKTAPAEPQSPALPDDPPSPRETERRLYRELVADPRLVGKSLVHITAVVGSKDSGLEQAKVEILARAIHKRLAKDAAELAKQEYRHPDVRSAAIAEAVTSAYPDAGAVGEAEHGAFVGGFDHALAGKTKSTLSGDELPAMLRGYEAAQKWIETEEGAAWYEGRPVNKLTNTGVDLRRWFDKMKEGMRASETDIKKAWAQIERATNRADLFSPLLPEGALPGFRLYVEHVRSHTKTFKDWLNAGSWNGSSHYRSSRSEVKSNVEYILDGERYPSELSSEDREKFRTDESYRISYLQGLAQEYLAEIRPFIETFENKGSVKDAALAFDEKYIDAAKLATEIENNKGRSAWGFLSPAGKKLLAQHTRGVWDSNESHLSQLRSGSMWTETLIEKEATIALPDRSTPLTPPRLDRVTRNGKDWRGGKDITPKAFKAKFGFADVGFGKWVGSKQDQDHLNYAHDAFMDLAAHFGMAPENIGFGGRLHFTIGALGHGKYAAHFHAAQPGPDGTVEVINVTNTRGDGTVYHEWIHALDHYLGRGSGWGGGVRHRVLAYLKNGVMSKKDIDDRALDFLVRGSYYSGEKRADKIDSAQKGLRLHPGRGTSAYKSNADKLGKDYWGNDHELIARAAEAWAADTLGFTNDYLVNPGWVGDEAVSGGKGYRGTPYPSGEERKHFNLIYTALAKAVKWDKGVPSVTRADFDAALPAEITEGESRRQDLIANRGLLEALRDDAVLAKAERVAERAADERAKKKAEQDELDALAAAKIAELAPPVVDAPPAADTKGPLDEGDLSALFDEAAAELREAAAEQPDVPEPGASIADQAPDKTLRARAESVKATDATAGKLIAEAAKLGVKGADEALKGLSALFGKPGRLNSFPGGFDEDTYAQAKPHFQAALSSFQAAGKTLKDLFKLLIGMFGDGIKEYAVRFAKDEGLTAQLGAKPSASMQVGQWVRARLAMGHAFDWRVLFDKTDEVFGGTQAEGKYTPKDAYDAAEVGMNLYIAQSGNKFSPNADVPTALLTVKELAERTNLLPTQTKRTAEQDEFQQFSTVPALAYVANWAANVTAADVMLEPSAGVGGLAVFAKVAGAQLVLNELSSRRAAVMQELFPSARVFHENAEQLDNILPDDIEPSVVVMNPPFSSTAGRMEGQRNSKNGARHIEQALGRLAKGGRLVAIVGKGMAMSEPAFTSWWRKIRAEYDVRAVIPVDGKGYAKYGTTYDNVVMVVDKIAPVAGREPVTTPADDYTALVGLLATIRDERPASNVPSRVDRSDERDAAESARSDAVPGGGREDGLALDDPGAAPAVGAGEPASRADVAAGGGKRTGSGRGGRTRADSGSADDAAARASADAAGSGAADAASDGRPDPGGQRTGLAVTASDAATAALSDSIFESYTPQRLKVAGAQPHPGPLVQSAAMASVLPPAPTYAPNLPKETITKGKLSLAQIEAVVYAGQAHSEFLDPVVEKGSLTPVTYRRGFFIGDGTGVGKGREIGGILLDNIRQGRKRHVWVSEKQGLINDAKRDFKGVGGDDSIIFNQNKTDAEEAIKGGNGILFTTYSTLRSGATSQAAPETKQQFAKVFKPGVAVKLTNNTNTFALDAQGIDPKNKKLFVTYNGRSTAVPFGSVESIDGIADWQKGRPATKDKKAGQSRLTQLANWLGPDFDGVIAFDETHNAGNAIAIKGERGFSQPSAQALAVVELQRLVPNARVLYVSATGATEVSNLSFATRLGLWGAGTPFPTVNHFIAQMTAGGLATMELVARDMKQMGAYIARSLSFDGVTYSRVEHELTPLQRDMYDRMADGWQVTLQHFLAALQTTGAVGDNGETRSSGAVAAAKSAYWGAQQRFFNQILTSMQMPTMIEHIERDLANGDAVLVQLVNTNEAQQTRALAKKKEEGESTDLEDLDLTPRDQLMQMVLKSYPVNQYEETRDAAGKKISVPVLDAAGNPVQNKEAVAKRDQLLKDLAEIRVPDGPLEMLLNAFGPDVVAEVTGRTQRVVNKPDKQTGDMKKQLETRGAAAARADADAFMADKKKILVFSDAGGTGFSFHADLTKANQRKRKHYLAQPGWRADKAIQGLGRSHRTNQKSAPHYGLGSTDVPSQKRFLSAIARRLNQLGALTKGSRDSANQGLFNEKDNLESKYATQAIRQLLDDIQAKAVEGLEFRGFLSQMGLEDLINPDTGDIPDDKYPPTRQFLNRMLSLRLDVQTTVFDAFIQRMEDKVEVAAARGELDTGMQTIRALSSKVLRQEVVYTDPRTAATTQYVELELTHPNRFHSMPKASYYETTKSKMTWVVNAKSDKVYAKVKSGQETDKQGTVIDRYRMLGVSGTTFRTGPEVNKAGSYREITEAEGHERWEKETAERPKTYTDRAHMIVGAILPIWDRFPETGVVNVSRTQTDDGQRLLGRVIEKRDIADVLKRLNVESAESKLPPAAVMERILKGDRAELANGWKLFRARVSDDLRIEMNVGSYPGRALTQELVGMGAILERIGYAERLFVPVGQAGIDMLDRLLKTKPVVSLKGDEPEPETDFAQGWESVENIDNPSTVASATAEAQALFGPDFTKRVTIVPSIEGLPPSLRKVSAHALAVTVDSQHVYIMADRVPQGAVRGLVMHELGVHVGMSSHDIERLTAQVKRWAAGEGQLAEMAQRAIRGAEQSKSTTKSEETLAYMVQSLTDTLLRPAGTVVTETGLVARFMRIVRNALRAAARTLGLNVELSPMDVVSFAYGAAKMALKSGVPVKKGTGTDFSVLDTLRRFDQPRDVIAGRTTRAYTPEQLAAMQHVGFQTQTQTIEQRARSLWKDAGKKLAQGIVDQFAPVKDMDRHAYTLLRLANGASGAFETLLQGGKLKIRDGAYDFDASQRGGVVKRLLTPMQGEHHDALRWIAANRAEQLTEEERENLFTEDDIAALKTLADGVTSFDYEIQTGAGRGQVTRDRTLIYADFNRVLNEFGNNVLDMAEESDLIDGESRAVWERDFYVPFYRVTEDGDITGADVKSGVVRQTAFQRLKGGADKLNSDLLDNVLMNWAHLLDASAKNRAAKASVEAAERLGMAQPIGIAMGKGTVWFREQGQKRYSMVSDPYFMTAVSALAYNGMRSPMMEAMGTLKHVLTVGVTSSPFFKVRNLIRDSLQAIGTAPISYNVAANVKEGWKLTNPESDSYFRLLASGGTIHFGTMYEGSEAKRVQRLVAAGVKEDTILDGDNKLKKFYRTVFAPAVEAYNELGNRGEAINRATLYAQLVRQGVSHSEAALQARDLMDFSMQGAFTSIRFLTQTVPFFNARIQGLYKLGRAAKEDPARFSLVTGAAALISIALLAANSDDDDWKKREEWDRNTYWWFKFGGIAFRIPKPFEIGAIATLAERTFELAFEKEMTGARFRDQVKALLADNLSLNPIPQLVKPLLDVYANVDSFTGRPIETMGMERLAPDYRFNEQTSMTARAASTAANAVTGIVGVNGPSPLQIDHLLRGYFGWLGSFVVGAGDTIARLAVDKPAAPSPDYWKVATGGLASDLDDAPSRYVSQVYTQAKAIEQAYGTWHALRTQGKFAEADDFEEAHREEIARYRSVERVKSQESSLGERLRRMRESNLSAEEKRVGIREIQKQRDRVARALVQ